VLPWPADAKDDRTRLPARRRPRPHGRRRDPRLSNHAYWALGRSRAEVERTLANSYRVVGVFHEGAQVGYCRAISDGVVHAYLADVYILEQHRGQGLATAMVQEMVEGGDGRQLRWLLHTRDAQALYRRFGFGAPSERLMERSGA
jgi:ribosomal protein S18 acetylase RimI-like enzyme